MSKSDLIQYVKDNAGLSTVEARNLVNGVLNCIRDGLVTSGEVTISGFGRFEVRNRKARRARNPISKELVYVPEQKTVSFRAGRPLKLAVNDQ